MVRCLVFFSEETTKDSNTKPSMKNAQMMPAELYKDQPDTLSNGNILYRIHKHNIIAEIRVCERGFHLGSR